MLSLFKADGVYGGKGGIRKNLILCVSKCDNEMKSFTHRPVGDS